MSEKVKNSIDEFFVWITRGLILTNIWFLSQMYYDFQNLKTDMQMVKVKISAMESNLEMLKNFDLKPKH